MARAKQTNRSEARRRYRQASTQAEIEALEMTSDDQAPSAAPVRPGGRPEQRAASPAPGRPSFLGAFRAAYHPARLREDLGHLPMLLRSRALLAGIALVLVGAAAALAFPGYTGSAFAWELLVLPGSALAPQLVAGFFAPRASYLLGLIVGIVQGVIFTLFLTQFAGRLGATLQADQVSNLLVLSFVTGPVSGLLFASAAAWYRRFLALSSPRRAAGGRAPAGRGQAGRGGKPNASRGAARRQG